MSLQSIPYINPYHSHIPYIIPRYSKELRPYSKKVSIQAETIPKKARGFPDKIWELPGSKTSIADVANKEIPN